MAHQYRLSESMFSCTLLEGTDEVSEGDGSLSSPFPVKLMGPHLLVNPTGSRLPSDLLNWCRFDTCFVRMLQYVSRILDITRMKIFSL